MSTVGLRPCRLDGCDVMIEGRGKQYCTPNHTRKARWQRDQARVQAAREIVSAPQWAGTVIWDEHRNVAVGAFPGEEEGLEFMLEQGHSIEHLRAIDVVTPEEWAKTGEM